MGLWSLLDQGTVSVGNFLTQMFLARELSINDYGLFALIYGTIFFLISSLGTVVTYPLSVMGASTDERGLRRLAAASLWFDVGVLLPGAAIVLIALAALHRLDLFLPVFVLLAVWQFQETLRRSLMAHLSHRDAALGDGVSYLGQALAILALSRTGSLTLQSALLVIAATSAAAAFIQFLQVKPQLGEVGESRALVAEYWRLGRWASSTNLASGLTQQAFPWVLGMVFGVAEAGSLQAIVNPLKVFNPVLIGAQNLIVPSVAKVQRERGTRVASRNGLAYAAAGSVLFLPYLFVLLVWPHTALGLLYGFHSPYSYLELPLRICVFAYAIGYWGDAVNSLLNGLGRPKAGFLAQFGAMGAAIALGLPLILKGRLVGAIVGLGICALVKVGIALYIVRTGALAEKAQAL